MGTLAVPVGARDDRAPARVARSERRLPISQGRLTHVQLLFTWNPSPLRSTKFSFVYLLLPPRSAPKAAPRVLTHNASTPPTRPPTHRGLAFRTRCPDGPVWVARSSAIHFQGCSIRQVSCYTLLSGFRLPWPPSCCLYRPTPFVVSDERALGTLTGRLVHPTAPVLLTKNGPLGTLRSLERDPDREGPRVLPI